MKVLRLLRISGWKSPIRFRPIVRALLLIVRSGPGAFWSMMALNLAFSAGPAVLLWLGKVVIDQIAAFGRATPLDWGLLTGNHAPLIWGMLGFVVSIPSVYVQLDYQTRQWSVESAQAATVRQMNAHAEVLTRPAFAKDLRMYSLAPHFLQSWRTLFMAEMRAVRRQGTTRTLG
jgi:hypothetical protein